MAVANGTNIFVSKGMGLVANVFSDETLEALTGHVAIGHTRYSTTGKSHWTNAQPFFREVGDYAFALAHNGNLVNTAELASTIAVLPGDLSSDSELIAELLSDTLSASSQDALRIEDALQLVAPQLKGAYSLVLCDASTLVGVRDPHGFWPLMLGQLNGGYVLASETAAFDVIGATFLREVEPGEMVIVDDHGLRSTRLFPAEDTQSKLCVFEFVYFHRPDGYLYGKNVHQARVRMGEQLAYQAPVAADLVMGVPESGVPAAEGFARQSGIPFGHGLVKNRYVGRTFIAPSQKLRALGVKTKLNPLKEAIEGKRLVVVDDSIVRGTTTKALVGLLREAGAAEVHLRISSPPYRWPCFYGMDTGKENELLAARATLDEIVAFVEADSLAYLSWGHLVDAIGVPEDQFCNACLTGAYPVEVPVALSKQVLELRH
jgi:amidophosphoribosyltransferase